jgi:beta-glucosidase
MAFDFDFIGIQYYYRTIAKKSMMPGMRAKEVMASKRGVPDRLKNGRIHDSDRIKYFSDHLSAVLKARREGVNVNGYFVWSPTDNFEWDKGFSPRFGLVYIDYKTLDRYLKDSGIWFREFLKK